MKKILRSKIDNNHCSGVHGSGGLNGAPDMHALQRLHVLELHGW